MAGKPQLVIEFATERGTQEWQLDNLFKFTNAILVNQKKPLMSPG